MTFYLIYLPNGEVKITVNAIDAWLYMRLYIERYFADSEVDLKAANEELEKKVQENKECFGVEYLDLRAVKTELLDWDSIQKVFGVDELKIMVNGQEVSTNDFTRTV